MADPKQAAATQLANIETRTGKSLDELTAMVRETGLSKHGEIRTWLKDALELGYGDANALAHAARQRLGGAEAPPADPAEAINALYSGPKANLRAIHDAVMVHVAAFGEFEIAPKKAYISLRHAKQFATLGPATKTRVDLGLNIKDALDDPRAEPTPKAMCDYRIKLTDADDVDGQVACWLRMAYDAAG